MKFDLMNFLIFINMLLPIIIMWIFFYYVIALFLERRKERLRK